MRRLVLVILALCLLQALVESYPSNRRTLRKLYVDYYNKVKAQNAAREKFEQYHHSGLQEENPKSSRVVLPRMAQPLPEPQLRHWDEEESLWNTSENQEDDDNVPSLWDFENSPSFPPPPSNDDPIWLPDEEDQPPSWGDNEVQTPSWGENEGQPPTMEDGDDEPSLPWEIEDDKPAPWELPEDDNLAPWEIDDDEPPPSMGGGNGNLPPWEDPEGYYDPAAPWDYTDSSEMMPGDDEPPPSMWDQPASSGMGRPPPRPMGRPPGHPTGGAPSHEAGSEAERRRQAALFSHNQHFFINNKGFYFKK